MHRMRVSFHEVPLGCVIYPQQNDSRPLKGLAFWRQRGNNTHGGAVRHDNRFGYVCDAFDYSHGLSHSVKSYQIVPEEFHNSEEFAYAEGANTVFLTVSNSQEGGNHNETHGLYID